MSQSAPAPSSARVAASQLERLPSLPGSTLEFIRLCDDPDAGAADVARAANPDPGLVMRIVQVANSPFYAPREPVTDVGRASAILGLRALKMIGVGFAVLGELWSQIVPSAALGSTIGASVVAGSSARSFSVRLGTGRDEEALTAGLLSYVGELALLYSAPDEFGALHDEHGRLPSSAEQKAVFGTDGVELGIMLLERWDIPPVLRCGAESRLESVEDRVARRPDIFRAALGFGTVIADGLAARTRVLDYIERPAREWGIDTDGLLEFWGDFRLSLSRTNKQLGVDHDSELDRLIVTSKTDYLESSVHALSELDLAQRELAELRQENARLADLSLTDPLTGVPNRAAFNAELRSCTARLARGRTRGLGIAMFDLDGFKRINDEHGHQVGDEVLYKMAQAGAHAVRTDELFARLGGDEFVLVLEPESIEEMRLAVERLRHDMTAAAAQLDSGLDVGVSAGGVFVAGTCHESVWADERALVKRADDALYEAKHAGRNTSVVTSHDQVAS
jgi:diguanylate cyclase (GGDEF)-like protein